MKSFKFSLLGALLALNIFVYSKNSKSEFNVNIKENVLTFCAESIFNKVEFNQINIANSKNTAPGNFNSRICEPVSVTIITDVINTFFFNFCL